MGSQRVRADQAALLTTELHYRKNYGCAEPLSFFVIFGCTGSSLLLCFSSCGKWGLLSSCGVLLLLLSHFSRVLTLCDPMDCSPPGSSAHGIFQARVLEWGAIASHCGGFSRGGAWALGWEGSVVVPCWISCPTSCGIFLDQGWTRVPCFGRQISHHWSVREVLEDLFLKYQSVLKSLNPVG